MLTIQGIRSNDFLPRAIQASMWIYVVRVNIWRFFSRKPYLKFIKCCNHWSIIIDYTEWEAIANGVIRHNYSITHHQYVKEWKILVDNKANIIEYLRSQEGHKYEFLNFVFHILKVMGFRWLGSWNDRHHSCIELVNRALQLAGVEGIDKFMNPYETQILLEKRFGGHVVKNIKK